jgi:large subunit ribosomal protein L30
MAKTTDKTTDKPAGRAAGKAPDKSAAPKRSRSNAKASNSKRLTVTLTKSTIGFDNKQWLVVESLGLRRIHHTIEVADTPSVRGMIHKVRHLVTVTGGQ